jgi:hypothetical protein
MKKIIIAAILVLSFAGASFAASLTSTSITSAPGLSIYGGAGTGESAAAVNPMVKLSSGVNGMAIYDTTGYSIFTKHVKGTKIFGTPHDSTKMFYRQVTVDQTLSTSNCGSSSGEANFTGGSITWTSY